MAETNGGTSANPMRQRLASTVLPGLLLAAALMHIGYVASGGPPASVALVALGFTAYALAFVSVAGSFSARSIWSTYILPAVCLAAYVLWLLIAHLTSTAVVNPAYEQYQSDSLAFSAYSAHLVLAGTDPYAASMTPAAQTFHISPPIQTPTTDGGRISVQPYPALSFLFYVPFVFAHLQSMIWVNIGFQIATMLLVFTLVPAPLRLYFGLLFLIIPEYREYPVGSGTDVVWLPFMLGAAATWDRRPDVSGACLGLACAIKQEPWFVVPFALVHWWETSGRSPQLAARYAGIMVAAFALPNLPFILWHPAAWLAGVLSPLLSHPVPLGSGLVYAQTSGLFSLPLGAYTILWIGALIACVAAYAAWPQRLAWLPFIAPALVLFFSARSLQNYFIYWPMVLAVYAATAPAQKEQLARRGAPQGNIRRLGAVAAVALLFACVSVAAAAGEHVRLTQARAMTDPRTGYVDSITLAVENASARRLPLHFAVADAHNTMVFWQADQTTVAANSRTLVHLQPSALAAELPPTTDGFQVVAFDQADGIAVYERVPPAPALMRGVRNGALLSAVNAFELSPVRTPLGWDADSRAFLDGRLAVATGGPLGSFVRFRTHAHPGSADTVRVSQSIVPDTRVYTVWLRPSAETTRKGGRFGIAFSVTGRHTTCYFADVRAKRPSEYRRGENTYVVLPARANQWNRYDIGADFPSTEAITISVGEFARAAYDDDFGGIVERER